jgi:hypothetical protein
MEDFIAHLESRLSDYRDQLTNPLLSGQKHYEIVAIMDELEYIIKRAKVTR